jgi:hypothetical protein
MAETKLPRQVSLRSALFPKGDWVQPLIEAVNQFSLEVVQAFRFAVPRYKTLDFSTGAVVTDSFPISFPVDVFPQDVWVAGIPIGDLQGTAAVTVKWQPVVANLLCVRVQLLTGLSATTYSVRLGYR